MLTLCEAPWWMKGQLDKQGTTRLIPDERGEWRSHVYSAEVTDFRGLRYPNGYTSPDPYACRVCPWAKAYYWQHRHAGKGHHGILRALAFKWRIRILWRCWQANEPYDDARYLAALRRRNSPLIALIKNQSAAA